jgi:hypothetical protein
MRRIHSPRRKECQDRCRVAPWERRCWRSRVTERARLSWRPGSLVGMTIVDGMGEPQVGTCGCDCRPFPAAGIDEGVPVRCCGCLEVLSRPATLLPLAPIQGRDGRDDGAWAKRVQTHNGGVDIVWHGEGADVQLGWSSLGERVVDHIL